MGNYNPPGSDSAVELGCNCPRMDNRYGKGMYMHLGDPVFVTREDCPLHGNPIPQPEDDK